MWLCHESVCSFVIVVFPEHTHLLCLKTKLKAKDFGANKIKICHECKNVYTFECANQSWRSQYLWVNYYTIVSASPGANLIYLAPLRTISDG